MLITLCLYDFLFIVYLSVAELDVGARSFVYSPYRVKITPNIIVIIICLHAAAAAAVALIQPKTHK